MRVDRVKVIAEMAKQDMTTGALAEKAGISRSAVSAVRSGKSCRTSTIIHIARALNVEIDELR